MQNLSVAVVAALAMLPSVARADMACTYAPGKLIAATLAYSRGGFDDKPRQEVTLLLLPGGTAEYIASGTCTVLGFTGIRQGEALYTDDGLGRGLTVIVGKDHKLTVAHAAGWIGKGE